MQDRTRTTVLVGLCLFLIALVGIWWYYGFSLDFMRFFAAEPGDRPSLTTSPPPGCYYQEVQCIQAPCPPQLVCPSENPPLSGVVECDPLTQTVGVGAEASFIALGGSGLYAWFSPDGNPATGSTFSGGTGTGRPGRYIVTYATAGTKKVTVESARGTDAGTIDSIACTVIVTP